MEYTPTVVDGSNLNMDKNENTRINPAAFEESGKVMKFDMYLMGLNLAFEAHGIQHYQWHFRTGDPSLQQVILRNTSSICHLYFDLRLPPSYFVMMIIQSLNRIPIWYII